MNNFNESKVAIIGAGRWGFNHVRTANSLLKPNNITVFDSSEDTKSKINELNPEINFTSNFDSVLEDKSITACIIATPAETHFEIAKKSMQDWKDLWKNTTDKEFKLYGEILQIIGNSWEDMQNKNLE